MKRVMTILALLAAASISPLIFPLAESGRSSMDVLAKVVRAGDKGSHFGRFRPEPVIHPREPRSTERQ
jgi:hypothetical protein